VTILQVQDLVNWLDVMWDTFPPIANYRSVFFQPGPLLWDTPDRLVTVNPAPGAGFAGEELYEDRQGFQLRVRGAQGFQNDSEMIAAGLDALLMQANYPYTTSLGTLIKVVQRAGSAPAPLSGTPDAAERYTYTCSYIATIGVTPIQRLSPLMGALQ
jgi:hypothetical protein